MSRHRKSLVQYDVKALKHASRYIKQAQQLAGADGRVDRSLAAIALSITRPCAAIGAALEAMSQTQNDAEKAAHLLQELYSQEET